MAHVLSYKMTLIFWNSIIVPGAKNSMQSDQMRIMGLRVKEEYIKTKKERRGVEE